METILLVVGRKRTTHEPHGLVGPVLVYATHVASRAAVYYVLRAYTAALEATCAYMCSIH